MSIISVGNAARRFLWVWLSNATDREWTFLVMFLLQAALFFLLPAVGVSLVMLAILSQHSLLLRRRLRDDTSVQPDYFGSKNVGMIYWLMITTRRFAGVLVPQLISVMYGAIGCYARAFYIIARIMLLSSIIPFIVRLLKREAGAPAGAEAQA